GSVGARGSDHQRCDEQERQYAFHGAGILLGIVPSEAPRLAPLGSPIWRTIYGRLPLDKPQRRHQLVVEMAV
ncbi:MAG TPA: hypothetical protein VII38_12840, partial [Polyangia bacterium]